MKKPSITQILLVISTILNLLGGTGTIAPVMGGPVCPPMTAHAPLEVLDAGSLTK